MLLAAAALTATPAWAEAIDDDIASAAGSMPAANSFDGSFDLVSFQAPAVAASGYTAEPSTCLGEGLNPSGCYAQVAPATWNLADFQTADGQMGTNALTIDTLKAEEPAAASASDLPGPPPPRPARIAGVPVGWADHVPRDQAYTRGFFNQAGKVWPEMALLFAYFGMQSGKKLFHETADFHFNNEGWFSTNTSNVGIDKLTHAFDTYLIAEVLHGQLHRKTQASEGDALTAGILASALMAFNELSDGIEPDSGYSMQDVTMNTLGAAFSVLRNTVPGLKEKVAFKIEIMPDSNIYSVRGKPHYAQQRYMLSLKGAGFEELRKTPLRYLDLQVGYYASDFLIEDREAGIVPKQHLFVGVGLNLSEILFGRSKSRIGKAAYTVLDYFQVPYTSLRYDMSQDRVFTSTKP
jgi:hypothetical protein